MQSVCIAIACFGGEWFAIYQSFISTSYNTSNPSHNLCSPLIISAPHSTIQIIPNSPPKLSRPLPNHRSQILNIIPRRDPKFPHKILRRILHIATVIPRLQLILWTAKVRVRADGGGAFETL